MGSTTEQTISPAGLRKRKRDKGEHGGHKQSKRARSKLSPRMKKEGAEAAVELMQPTSQNGELAAAKLEGGDRDLAVANASAWKLSEPMGGRMTEVDPIFSKDEKYIIITYDTSIQVYSTEDSLLVRKIPLLEDRRRERKHDSEEKPKLKSIPRIVATVASLVDADTIWVADSRRSIWKMDWTTGAVSALTRSGTEVLAMTSVQAKIGKVVQEVLVTSEVSKKTACQLAAYPTVGTQQGIRRHLHNYSAEVRTLKVAAGGTVLVGAGGSNILLGSLQDRKVESIADLSFEFYSFDTPDEVCCLDSRTVSRKASGKKKTKQLSGATADQAVDVVAGCVRGSIFVYSDILALVQAVVGGSTSKSGILPRKYHWHQRAVHSVKWSLDGEYIVSGGTENTLVLWQVDTGRLEFLPHLSASIESIVVSPLGSSYAVVLDDNSAMVLSTSEMKPTTYISGLQSLVLRPSPRKDASVDRVWVEVDEISQPLTATIHPTNPSQLLLCVGNGQIATATDSIPSTSLLQTFDIGSFQSVSKQPLARTTPTEANITPKGFPVTEPWVSHLSFSHNGEWLASVDEWQPPLRDMESVAEGGHAVETLCLERKEVYLKFWRVGQDGNSLELVSRLDEAHFTTWPESILDLAASPKTTLFGTVGADGDVRLWAPYTQHSGRTPSAAGGDAAAQGWWCVKIIPLAVNSRFDGDLELAPEGQQQQQHQAPGTTTTDNISGALTFSDDGSTLFVASGLPDEVVLYMIDAASGRVHKRLHDLIRGEVRSLRVLGSCLIVLAGSLVVYDVVEDRVRYGVAFDRSPAAALRMTHLAVDGASGCFAIAVPSFPKPKRPSFGSGVGSEVAVFSPLDSRPLLVRRLPHLVVSLLPVPAGASKSSPGGGGAFVALDSAAQVSAVIRGTAANPLALPLSDLRLEGVNGTAVADEEEERGMGMELDLVGPTAGDVDGEEDDGSVDGGLDAMDEDGEDEDMDMHCAVVVPERLTEIFDAAPAFALPPIEDLFYRVSSLISAKPLASTAA